jgi:CarD family transcriptional regulator
MKASGTAAQSEKNRRAAAAKPVSRSKPTVVPVTAKSAAAKPAAAAKAAAAKPAAAKPAVRPAAARAAATAVASKAAPVTKKATASAPRPAPQDETPKPPARPVAKPIAAKPVAAPATPSPLPPEPAPVDAAPAVPPSIAAPEAAAPQAAAVAAATPVGAPRPSIMQPPRRPGTPTGPITLPRPPAKAEVFQEGDHVVYPTHGVGRVERIATEEIAGHKLELIHITFEENRMTLRVPVAKARTAGLRKLATRKLFDEALMVLKGRARIKRTMWSRRAQEYEAKINSGDPLAIAEVVRDLHRNAGQPDQSFSERQIYEAAMDRLAAELAALDKTDKITAATKLTDFLKTV